MNTNIKMYQSSNVTQQLNLAPQLLNWLKILQVSSVELSELVDRELVSNPALEAASPEESPMADDIGSDVLASSADGIDLCRSEVGERLGVLADIDEEWRLADEPRLSSSHVLQEKHDFTMDHIASTSRLQDELEQAILFADLSETHAEAARIIAGSIDGRGYLDASLEDIAKASGLDVSEIAVVLEKFQALAPAGIGARDLRECLTLQLKAMDSDTELAQMLVNNWLDHLAAGRAVMVADHLGEDADKVEAAFRLIRTLDPEPGKNDPSVPTEYVEADLEIRSKNGELHVELLDERLPKLQLSSYCKRLLDARQGSKADLEYIRGKVREASFLIQGISQRQDTMLKVARQIVRVQQEFLSSENGALQPLTMNKVAAMIGVHETTVSRAIANKYIRTERGLIEMRSFFKVGYRCADGSSVTPERVKTRLEAFIDAEEALKPLTDAHISERFKKEGLKVARRTVAKYREELGIPSSKERLIRARRREELAIAV
ncbi:RNA polymerase factor sigma-54 [Pontiella agarivorans]|uniref:RNA polymerase factor sigma-54 n=1 Tax=Pontiella agarivorans TaxID=3038953 RepID=A0ABU5MSR0_9BACT|nr:RNA polymerase factor sigma-54 [Pontiella agarivorans]MDZ8117239.1 RNA polymerase factor sigma-54 [Pontiella agarivorans]